MRWFDDRWLIAFVAACAMAVAMVARAREAEPAAQAARVVTAGAQVRSGPGESHYLTETLPEDAKVEVYKRGPDGWCAIRPPADSFSWVYAQHVRITDDGRGEITKSDVASRVGSLLSSHREAVQVKLHKGEIVHLVGDNELDSEWIKISPPAGEFRWVQLKDLEFVGGASEDEPTQTKAERPSHDVKLAAADSPVVDLVPPPLAGSTAASASPPAPLPAKLPAAPSPVTTPAPAAVAAPTTANPSAQDITPVATTPASSAEIAQQLSSLELRLSRMVAEPTPTWNVESLEQSAEQLLSRSNTVEDRQAVKATLAKIDRFAAIQRRATGAVGSTTTQPAEVDTSKLPGGPYDAVGTLRPVVSKRPGAPPFALVNEQGQVVSFITPSPDVNLQPYLGRQIGVVGSRGYVPEFRRTHVTASRVTPFSDKIVR